MAKPEPPLVGPAWVVTAHSPSGVEVWQPMHLVAPACVAVITG